jgi:hypothetical protein
MSPLSIVSAGVDSLYVSSAGTIKDGVHEAFRSVRALGTEGELVPIEMMSGAFLFRPHGWRGYPVWLSSPRYELMLCAAPPFPPTYAMLHAPFIHSVGVEAAVDDATRAVGEFVAGVKLAPSRIDVYVDFQGWVPTRQEWGCFVCRGVSKGVFEYEAHDTGRHLSGYRFGRGDVVARIYDKTVELRRRDADWPLAVWADADPALPVWRVEFQYRRKALTTFGLRSVEAALDARQELWEYGTRWLSLRVPTGDKRRSNWPEAPVWEALRMAVLGSPRSTLVRQRVRAADERRLLRGFAGYASSLAAAWSDDDLGDTLRRAGPAVRQHFAERGTTFRAVSEDKRRRRIGL